ncbi:MAG: nucleotide sugar dehydrogenase, partial [Anaerolineales bacterium]|nr:nucleotide sugar dehydrogenase [Anaerolineales bacterium]
MTSSNAELLERFANRTAVLGIVGLGYVGLPLAVEFARAGLRVIGVDVDPRKIEALGRGESYIQDVPAAEVADLVRRGRLAATTDYAELRQADAVSICVPTPLRKTRDPDMSYVIDAAEKVTAAAHPGMLIVLESTTYPGTTEEIFEPRLKERGFTLGTDIFLAFSPERIDPANLQYGVRNTPKVVGGTTPACTEAAVALYRLAVDTVVPVSSPRAAEMVKLLENTFRAVNIGLVNEVALMCAKLDLNVWEVIEAAATKPYGYMKFTPGPGIGGHCLSGEEWVFVRDKAGTQVLTLYGLVERLKTAGAEPMVETADLSVFAPQSLEVLSLDPSGGGAVYRRLEYVSRRRYAGPSRSIWTQDGRRLSTTDGHPMMIWSGEELQAVRADQLRPGDRLVVPLGQPETPVADIDLIAHITEADCRRMRVKPRQGRYADHAAALRPHLLTLKLSPRDVFKQNVMPLAAYLELERRGLMPFPRTEVDLVTGRGPSYNTFPAVVLLDEDFARLLGYYLSEGCLTDDAALRVRFTFHVKETEYIADLKSILEKLGVAYSEYRDRRWQSHHIKVSSRPLGLLVRDVLGCGVNCYTMKIPARFLGAPEPLRLALLAGLLRGDGDVHHVSGRWEYQKRGKTYTHHSNSCQAGYFSSSPVLFQQVARLLHGLDWVPTFKRTKPQLRLWGATQLERLTPLFLGEKRQRLEAYAAGRRKPMSTSHFERHPGFATIAVRTVEDAAPLEHVYSLEVEDTHTFVTSYGLLAHNCIPLDPLYLSWKLKSLNYTARFIELADTINSQMPHHVVTLVADALNEDGRALRGARVLVLGAAYKKDVDD